MNAWCLYQKFLKENTLRIHGPVGIWSRTRYAKSEASGSRATATWLRTVPASLNKQRAFKVHRVGDESWERHKTTNNWRHHHQVERKQAAKEAHRCLSRQNAHSTIFCSVLRTFSYRSTEAFIGFGFGIPKLWCKKPGYAMFMQPSPNST